MSGPLDPRRPVEPPRQQPDKRPKQDKKEKPPRAAKPARWTDRKAPPSRAKPHVKPVEFEKVSDAKVRNLGDYKLTIRNCWLQYGLKISAANLSKAEAWAAELPSRAYLHDRWEPGRPAFVDEDDRTEPAIGEVGFFYNMFQSASDEGDAPEMGAFELPDWVELVDLTEVAEVVPAWR